ncbi:MAG: hypothetical protein KGN74_04370 [Gemmatimonadota bacterium]|nr:hypothetical protein [Gemmatimonadota bacterium]MDE3172286.1 hypothetical protein [Gemmatimonadota bacterium]MDE3215833.1 hypothetical protein [Gemmatimonadota bacterium]
MSQLESQLDQVLEGLVRDVAAAVNAMYRGEVRQQTAKLKADAQRSEARRAILALIAGPGSPADTAPPSVAAAALDPDDVAAITRCILGWLPMGDPRTATPNSRCIPGAREIAPAWGERERARLAIRRAGEP